MHPRSNPTTHTTSPETEMHFTKILIASVVAALALIVLMLCWPFYSVPTGSRGVLTQFGAIKGIESEGLVIVPPWQKVNIFSIRAETADIDKASGSTSDTQPVDVDLTVRYSIMPDRGPGVEGEYKPHRGPASLVPTR